MYRTYRTRDALKTAIRNRLLKPSMRRTTYPVIERYIDDAVDALARTIDRGGGLVINVGTGVATSIEEVWKQIAMGSSLKARKVAVREEDISRLAVSNVRAKIQLGWAPWTSVEEGIAVIRDAIGPR